MSTNMKIDFKAGNEKFTIDFLISQGGRDSDADFVAMAKNSKELDKLQDYISKRNAGDKAIGDIIASVIEKKIGVPCDRSVWYKGAGFGISIDTYSLIKSKLQ